MASFCFCSIHMLATTILLKILPSLRFLQSYMLLLYLPFLCALAWGNYASYCTVRKFYEIFPIIVFTTLFSTYSRKVTTPQDAQEVSAAGLPWLKLSAIHR